MYLLSKLHPHLKHTEEKGYSGPWLDRKGKEEIIERFYKEGRTIPLCIDHKNVGKYGYVNLEDRVGRVCDLFIDKDGELIMKCELSKHHKSYKEVNRDIFTNKQRMGVSVGLTRVPDGQGGIKSSHLIHVALTPNPGFAAYDTYITNWALGEDDLNHAIVEKYGQEGLFVRGPLKAKLEGYKGRNRKTPAMQQPATESLDNNNSMETEGGEQQEQQQQLEQEQTGPLTLAQKKEKLKSLYEHCTTNGVNNFLNMDFAFREQCHTLEKEIISDSVAHNSHVVKLCDSKHLSPMDRDTVVQLLSVPSNDSADLQNLMVAYTAANVECLEAAERRYQQVLEENNTLKKSREQEQLNINAKRARSGVMPQSQPTYALPTQQQQSPKQQNAWAPTQNNRSVATQPQQKSLGQQFNFLSESKVVNRMPIGDERINNAVNPRMNGHEPIRQYNTPSAGVYAIFQNLGGEIDQYQASRKPAFTMST